MDRRFLRYYDQELRFVRDMAGEFASEHARVANRFGLDRDSCADPYVEWLLDGFAFMAARVQLKIDSEYERFTHHLLEMVLPNFATPVPAAGIAAFQPEANPALLGAGFAIPRETRLQSRAVGDTRCTFTTCHPVTLWPLRLASARHVTGGELATLALGSLAGARAALVLRLETMGEMRLADLDLDRLPLHLASNDRMALQLFEALTARATRMVVRSLGAPAHSMPAAEAIVRLGFAEDECLLPASPRVFSGYRLLQEYFTLPQRFLFVELRGLQPAVARATGNALEIVILLDAVDPVLDRAVTTEAFRLFATPIVNLFSRATRPIVVEPHEREHHVVADRVRPLDYEIWDILEVTGVSLDEKERRPFTPFYQVDHLGDVSSAGAYFATERRPRIVSSGERRRGGSRSAYLGSELFLQLADGDAAPWPASIRRLDVRARCTNRDLPMRLPLPAGESHLSTELGAPLAGIQVLGGLSEPRPAPSLGDAAELGPHGMVAWRLVGLLSLNYLSLLESPDDRGADALRAMLGLFAGRAPQALQRQVEGLQRITAKRAVDRLPGGGPITFGRGLEVTMELQEGAFAEGSAFMLGSVMEGFFRRWVGVNSFVRTVVRTSERGELVRWPARIGSRHPA